MEMIQEASQWEEGLARVEAPGGQVALHVSRPIVPIAALRARETTILMTRAVAVETRKSFQRSRQKTKSRHNNLLQKRV